MKKILAVIITAVMVFAMFGSVMAEEAASEPAAAEKRMVENFEWNGQMEVWSILPTTAAEGLILINDAMGAAMEAEGFTYVKKDAQGDPTAQVTFVEDAIAAGNVGCLMVAAMAVDMLEDVVMTAQEAGIAVAMLGAEPVNYQIGGCVYTAFEITGMYAVEAVEDWAANRLAEGGDIPLTEDGKIEVACDVYTDIQDGIYRSNAIVGCLDASETLERVATQSLYGEADQQGAAYNFAFDALAAHPNVRIFIAYEPAMALGYNQAIAQYCDDNGLSVEDFCVAPCYTEDTTFWDLYNASTEDHAAEAVKAYSTYGDPAIERDGEIITPPVLTGEHLATILMGVAGIEGYEWTFGETYYDTITAANVYGFAKEWKMGDENPAIEYKNPVYIG